MIRVKMLKGNETAVVDNGKSYVFDIGGRCSGEDVGNLVSYMEGACDLPIISVLSSSDYCEIGVATPGQDALKRYKTDMKAMDVSMTLMSAGGFIKVLRRNGTQQGVRFNQMLFIYRADFAVSSMLGKLSVTEV